MDDSLAPEIVIDDLNTEDKSAPKRGGKPKKATQKKPVSAKKEEKSKIELELLRETVSQNPYQLGERQRKAVHQKIAVYLNKKFPVPDPRDSCYVRDVLKRLLTKWRASDRAERKVTGGGTVIEPTEKERLLAILAEEEDKGYSVAQAETEKKNEEIQKVDSIQSKALVCLRAKTSSVESKSDEDDDTVQWRKECEEIHEEAMSGERDTESEAVSSASGDAKCIFKEKPGKASKLASSVTELPKKRQNRGALADQLCERKYSVEAKWRQAELETRSKDLALQLADKKEEREFRLRQLEFEKSKAEMEHNLKLLNLKRSVSRKKRRKRDLR